MRAHRSPPPRSGSTQCCPLEHLAAQLCTPTSTNSNASWQDPSKDRNFPQAGAIHVRPVFAEELSSSGIAGALGLPGCPPALAPAVNYSFAIDCHVPVRVRTPGACCAMRLRLPFALVVICRHSPLPPSVSPADGPEHAASSSAPNAAAQALLAFLRYILAHLGMHSVI